MGETLQQNGATLKLTDIGVAVGGDNKHPAIFEMSDSNGNVVDSFQLNPGASITETVNGNSIPVEVCQTAPGFTLSSKWAKVKMGTATESNTTTGYQTLSPSFTCKGNLKAAMIYQNYVGMRSHANATYGNYVIEYMNMTPNAPNTARLNIYYSGNLVQTINVKAGDTYSRTDNGETLTLWVDHMVYYSGSFVGAGNVYLEVCYTGPLQDAELNCTGSVAYATLKPGQLLNGGNYGVGLNQTLKAATNARNDASDGVYDILYQGNFKTQTRLTESRNPVYLAGNYPSTQSFNYGGEDMTLANLRTYSNKQFSPGEISTIAICYGSGTVITTDNSTNLTPPDFPNASNAQIQLHNGWNLISFNAPLVSFDKLSANSKILGFIYLPDENRYVSMSQAQSTLGSQFGAYFNNHAFWVYSYADQTLSATVLKPTAPTYALVMGWNIEPIAPAMAGKSMNDISGTCTASPVYVFDPQIQGWTKIDTAGKFGSSDVGGGMIINVQNACSLST